MEKHQLTEEVLSALRNQMTDLFIFDSLTDSSLSYNHSLVDTIYHYTDLATFLKIVETQSFWASHVNCLNDKTETTHGINLIKELIKETTTKENKKILKEVGIETRRIMDDRFVTCFSKNGDLKSQWVQYANYGKGISIGFNKRILQSHLKGVDAFFSHKYILYDLEQQRKVIKHCLERGTKFFLNLFKNFEWEPYRFEQVAAVCIIEFLERIISDYKDVHYSEEMEFRIEVTIKEFMKAKKQNQIKYRSNNSLVIPYIVLELDYHHFQRTKKEDEGEPTFIVKQLPIEEIIVGYSLDFDGVSFGLNHFLKSHGYNNVSIKPSKVPLRG